MKHTSKILSVFLILMPAVCFSGEWKSGISWKKPEVLKGKAAVTTPAPEDAVILFDGKDLSAWNGGEKWLVKDGYAEVRKPSISTKQEFGSCKLHLEWAAPEKVKSSGQGRGNSGVFLMGRYEVQILDSYNNDTYYDGQCGAIYKQHPPLKNVCNPPGEWNSYDIEFSAPVFEGEKLVKPAFITVYQNGVLIQDNWKLQGSTAWHKPPEYEPHGPKGPIILQDHGNPVRFRNIWIQEIKNNSEN
ncbi:MAG: DUF1080 domain-containing protein [Planctomycetia bacterium]|nr:DUF1080 domain-containing protein [Planctomycetia bacterium]